MDNDFQQQREGEGVQPPLEADDQDVVVAGGLPDGSRDGEEVEPEPDLQRAAPAPLPQPFLQQVPDEMGARRSTRQRRPPDQLADEYTSRLLLPTVNPRAHK